MTTEKALTSDEQAKSRQGECPSGTTSKPVVTEPQGKRWREPCTIPILRSASSQLLVLGLHAEAIRLMSNLPKHLCVIPDCPNDRAESTDYCVQHHREYEECDMVDAVEGPDVVGKVCSICGAEKDYSDD